MDCIIFVLFTQPETGFLINQIIHKLEFLTTNQNTFLVLLLLQPLLLIQVFIQSVPQGLGGAQ